ncbi:unnamed protein product [Diabrotica balteata]|uniref:Uncharacterized protein n=1 Tax=Diabrotica balteata TaxID=107213 RepID=A0A9N9SRT9_DIABA|nr:unnamed protein product [Diabrotica balteata]
MVECKKAQPKEMMLPANLAKTCAAGRGVYDLLWSLGALPDGFPAAAYAAYAAGRGYSGYPSFGLLYQAVMNNYQAAAAAQAQAQGFGPPTYPHTTDARAGFPAANSSGPTIDMYNSSADSVGYVQAAIPQPRSFPAIAYTGENTDEVDFSDSSEESDESDNAADETTIDKLTVETTMNRSRLPNWISCTDSTEVECKCVNFHAPIDSRRETTTTTTFMTEEGEFQF